MKIWDEETAIKGRYLAPRIFKYVDRSSKIYMDEIFVPVLCVGTFKTEAQALAMANDTE